MRRIDLHDHLVSAHEVGGYDIPSDDPWGFFDHPGAVDMPVKAGQLVISDARLLHGTWANTTGTRRSVLLGWYYRSANDVPAGWDGDVPREILERGADHPKTWAREPGEFLR